MLTAETSIVLNAAPVCAGVTAETDFFGENEEQIPNPLQSLLVNGGRWMTFKVHCTSGTSCFFTIMLPIM